MMERFLPGESSYLNVILGLELERRVFRQAGPLSPSCSLQESSSDSYSSFQAKGPLTLMENWSREISKPKPGKPSRTSRLYWKTEALTWTMFYRPPYTSKTSKSIWE